MYYFFLVISEKKQYEGVMGKKKTFSTSIDEDRIKELKHLAVDTDKSLGKLLEEAIADICKKYKKKLAT